MCQAKRTATADELLRMPDDGFRYELVHGELRRMSPGGYRHGLVAAELLGALREHVRRGQLGRVSAAETGFLLADGLRAPYHVAPFPGIHQVQEGKTAMRTTVIRGLARVGGDYRKKPGLPPDDSVR